MPRLKKKEPDFIRVTRLIRGYGYQTKNWYYVRTASGKEGYVSKKYVRKL